MKLSSDSHTIRCNKKYTVSQDSSVIRFGRTAAGTDEPDDDEDRDPEMEEELLSRDWPEASKPLRGGVLKWKFENNAWSRFLGDTEAGPRWVAVATPVVSYLIWATRKFNEDWRGDYYTYDFNCDLVITNQKNKRSKPERKRTPIGNYTDTLAEAQKECDEHAKDNFLG